MHAFYVHLGVETVLVLLRKLSRPEASRTEISGAIFDASTCVGTISYVSTGSSMVSMTFKGRGSSYI